MLLWLYAITAAPSYAANAEPVPIKEIQELVRVLELIKKNHVTPKSDQELLLAAINGMLSSLDDQSRYLTAEELAVFTRVATGQQPGKTTTEGKIIADGIAYMDIDYFHNTTAQRVQALWQELAPEATRGLIIDLRDNPGGFVDAAVAVADLLLDDGLITSSRGRVAQASRNYSATNGQLDISVPILVLIDAKTASAAEIVAAALQDYGRARLAGQTSYGKGSIQSLMNTEHGAIQLTTSYYYSPKGRIIHELGVKPDITLNDEQRALLAETPEIQYHLSSDGQPDWQLSWAIESLKQSLQ